jgi:hypothetical protein
MEISSLLNKRSTSQSIDTNYYSIGTSEVPRRTKIMESVASHHL